MKLDNIKPAEGSVKNLKRIARGTGSGRGGTSTRGHKGAKSRSGYSRKVGFEGGQMPLQRRIPKFGFNNPNRKEFKGINLDVLDELIIKTKASIVDFQLLKDNGFASKNDRVKILGRGEFKSKVEIKAHAFSSSALVAIENAGSKATTI